MSVFFVEFVGQDGDDFVLFGIEDGPCWFQVIRIHDLRCDEDGEDAVAEFGLLVLEEKAQEWEVAQEGHLRDGLAFFLLSQAADDDGLALLDGNFRLRLARRQFGKACRLSESESTDLDVHNEVNSTVRKEGRRDSA